MSLSLGAWQRFSDTGFRHYEVIEPGFKYNMTDIQVQYASVISASGKDLMGLLNSILDLAKAESGTMAAEPADGSGASESSI